MNWKHTLRWCLSLTPLSWAVMGCEASAGGEHIAQAEALEPAPVREMLERASLYDARARKGAKPQGAVATTTGSVIEQGSGNVVEDGNYATISGGLTNTVAAAPDGDGSDYATIGGGYDNTVSESSTTVGGGYRNMASGNDATVAGGIYNVSSGLSASLGGGEYNEASGSSATVGGGANNTASGNYATAGGGYQSYASGSHAIVPGGRFCTAAGDYSFAAGRRAKANNNGSFVWADATDADFASSANNQFAVRASGGIYFNAPSLQLGTSATSGYVLKADASGKGTWQAETGDISEVKTGIGLTSSSGTGPIPTVSLKSCTSTNQILKWTGSDWTCQSDANSGGTLTSITQGTGLTVTSSSTSPTLAIAPLYLPTSCSSGQVSSWSSSSGWTCVTGGSGSISSVTGTNGITASSNSGAVSLSLASTYTLPQSCADGTLPVKNGATWICSGLLASNGGYTLKRTKGDLVFGADGTVALYSSTGTTAGVSLAPGSSMWRALSDRNAKRDLKPVDTQAILEQVGTLEISTWKYKEQSGDVDHIGPMAQDFYAAFRMGEDNTHIGTVDADGVNMAAIQGLLKRSRAQEKTIQMLMARLERLEHERGIAPTSSHQSPLSSVPAGVGWVAVGVGIAAMLKRAWK